MNSRTSFCNFEKVWEEKIQNISFTCCIKDLQFPFLPSEKCRVPWLCEARLVDSSHCPTHWFLLRTESPPHPTHPLASQPSPRLRDYLQTTAQSCTSTKQQENLCTKVNIWTQYINNVVSSVIKMFVWHLSSIGIMFCYELTLLVHHWFFCSS